MTDFSGNELTSRLGIRHPVIQGPFGGNLSTVELLATVSNAGGMGSYGAHLLSGDEILALGRRIREATDGCFALNLWAGEGDAPTAIGHELFESYLARFKPYYDALGVAYPAYPQRVLVPFEEQVQAVLEARPPVFSFVFGIPSPEVLRACRQRGITTVGAATTVEEVDALDAAGVDVVLATGFEAGGHRASFLRRAESSLVGTLALTRLAASRCERPVIAAGGIADGGGIRGALALGAQAAQVGTAFLACEESGASDSHRDQLFSPDARHTVLHRGYTGRLARFIPDAFLADIDECDDLPLPYPWQGWFTAPLKRRLAELGRGEMASHYAGQGAPLLRHRRAVELFDSLVAEL